MLNGTIGGCAGGGKQHPKAHFRQGGGGGSSVDFKIFFRSCVWLWYVAFWRLAGSSRMKRNLQILVLALVLGFSIGKYSVVGPDQIPQHQLGYSYYALFKAGERPDLIGEYLATENARQILLKILEQEQAECKAMRKFQERLIRVR